MCLWKFLNIALQILIILNDSTNIFMNAMVIPISLESRQIWNRKYSQLLNKPPTENDIKDTINDLMSEMYEKNMDENEQRTVVVVVTTNIYNIENPNSQRIKEQHSFLSFGPPHLLMQNKSSDLQPTELTLTTEPSQERRRRKRNTTGKKYKYRKLNRDQYPTTTTPVPNRDSNSENEKFLSSLLCQTKTNSPEDQKSREELLNSLRFMQRRIRNKRVNGLQNFDEYLAAASLFNFRKMTKVPSEYLTGNPVVDNANLDKLKKLKIYRPPRHHNPNSVNYRYKKSHCE